jgi:hypothetical protein
MRAIGRFFQYMGRDLLKYLWEWGATIICMLLLCAGIVLVIYGLGWLVHVLVAPLAVVTFVGIMERGGAVFSVLCIVSMVVFLIIHTFIPIVKWIISLIKRARHG